MRCREYGPSGVPENRGGFHDARGARRSGRAVAGGRDAAAVQIG